MCVLVGNLLVAPTVFLVFEAGPLVESDLVTPPLVLDVETWPPIFFLERTLPTDNELDVPLVDFDAEKWPPTFLVETTPPAENDLDERLVDFDAET